MPDTDQPDNTHGDPPTRKLRPILGYVPKAGEVVSMGLSYARAEVSPRVSDEEYARRYELCKACPRMEVHQEEEYCRACNCPKWSRSRLRVKLRMGRARCPLHKF